MRSTAFGDSTNKKKEKNTQLNSNNNNVTKKPG